MASLALGLILSHGRFREATGKAGLFNSCEAPGASEAISAEAQDAAWSAGRSRTLLPCGFLIPSPSPCSSAKASL